MKVKAANGFVRLLKEEGVEWISTFPTTVFNNACGEEGVRNFMVRDERYAVAVADGFSRVSNGKRIGVCSMMGGLNAAGIQIAYGAIAQAYEDSTPILCLTDGVNPNNSGIENYNIENAFKSITKWSGYINKPERVQEFVKRAFTYLRSGRPGPILLQLPRGLGEYDIDQNPYTPVKGWKSQGDITDVKKATRAIVSSQMPIIYAGQGIFYADACGELLRFAELVKAPVLTTLKGKSCFPEDHILSVGVRGAPADRMLKSADLILSIGCGLSPTHFSHRIPTPREKTIIHCTIDAFDINRLYNVDLAILGDAKLVLRQLIKEVEAQNPPVERKDQMEKLEAAKKEKNKKYEPVMSSEERPINPYRVYGELMKALDRNNSFVTHESGNTRDQLSTVYEALIPHGFMGWGNVSTLGFGLGAAMGAKLAFPKRQTVCITGDAGVGYHMGNYEALLRNDIGITIVHINNSGFAGYGPGFWGKGHSPFTSDLTSSEIQSTAKVAEGLGIYSERIEAPDEVYSALKRALKENGSDRPSFVEVICSKFPIYGSWVR
jgi:acetolactate synthase-1/2/3 large subunit